MTTWLAVIGAALAGFAALDAVRPAQGAADRMLRAVGGSALLALAAVATAAGSFAGAAIAAAVALPLLLAPALPWVIGRIATGDPKWTARVRSGMAPRVNPVPLLDHVPVLVSDEGDVHPPARGPGRR